MNEEQERPDGTASSGIDIDLAAHYAELQERWEVVDRSADYARLVVPSGNSNEPVHRWFHFKEAFSSQLVQRLRKDAQQAANRGRVRTLDPFCGSGTMLVSSLQSDGDQSVESSVVGIELNPFLHLLSSAKVAACLEGPNLSRRVRLQLAAFERAFTRAARYSHSVESVTLNNSEYFPPSHVQDLIALRKAASDLDDRAVKLIYLTAIAGCVEPSSKLRRDGRALRFEAGKAAQAPRDVFKERLAMILQDIDGLPSRALAGRVHLGDARQSSVIVGSEKFDWIVFSPPYPNNIDYTEVYKLESWALGLWKSPEEMKLQRLRTLRSHPSILFPESYNFQRGKHRSEVEKVLKPLLQAVPHDRYRTGRLQVIRGYADDMLSVFISARRVVAHGGRLVYVVGNSLHGSETSSFVIAADLLLARLAELAGWTIDEIRIARKLRRRAFDSEYLRESVVTVSA